MFSFYKTSRFLYVCFLVTAVDFRVRARLNREQLAPIWGDNKPVTNSAKDRNISSGPLARLFWLRLVDVDGDEFLKESNLGAKVDFHRHVADHQLGPAG